MRKKWKVIRKYIISLIIVLIALSPYLYFSYKVGVFQLVMRHNYIKFIATDKFLGQDPPINTIHAWLWYPKSLVQQLSIPIFILSVFSVFLLVVKRWSNWKEIIIWILIVYISLSLFQNKEMRYSITYLPAFTLSLSYFIGKTIRGKKYYVGVLAILIISIFLISFYSLPRYHYPTEEIAEMVYNNSKGNVAFVSEGNVYSSAFMFYLSKLDKNRTIMVYRPCVFDNITTGHMDEFLKENNIYYLILVENGYGIENFVKIKNVTLEKQFDGTNLYRYDGFDGKGTKKCNYVCLTQEEICMRNL
jgi:hypothetical protein